MRPTYMCLRQNLHEHNTFCGFPVGNQVGSSSPVQEQPGSGTGTLRTIPRLPTMRKTAINARFTCSLQVQIYIHADEIHVQGRNNAWNRGPEKVTVCEVSSLQKSALSREGKGEKRQFSVVLSHFGSPFPAPSLQGLAFLRTRVEKSVQIHNLLGPEVQNLWKITRQKTKQDETIGIRVGSVPKSGLSRLLLAKTYFGLLRVRERKPSLG